MMKNIFVYLFLITTFITQAYSQTKWKKYPDNPVLRNGSIGEWDDVLVSNPSVIFDEHDNKYRYQMWFTGSDNINGSRIGFAYSSDGISWTKYDDTTTTSPPYAESDPVLKPDPPGSWDGVTVYQPGVFRNPWFMSEYFMYFTGHDGTNKQQIGVAVAHGLEGGFEKYDDPTTTSPLYAESDPVLTTGQPGSWDAQWVGTPEVVFAYGYSTGLHMWYSGSDGTYAQIGHATSLNGIDWIKDTLNNPVLTVGPSGSWDEFWVIEPSVIYDWQTGIFHMWYSGGNGFFNWRTGYAYSTDGIHWTKYDDTTTTSPPNAESDPVLTPGPSGSWDETMAGLSNVTRTFYSDSTTHFDNSLKMWYSGGVGTNIPPSGNIGYAYSDYIVSVEENNEKQQPVGFSLYQNYPNPFNPITKIRYQVPSTDLVSIRVYNILGEVVATLVNEEKPVGSYEVVFNASNLSSGVYFYQLQAGGFVESKKMILLK